MEDGQMRAGFVVGVVALSLCSAACYADTVVENFTANGNGNPFNVTSSTFSQFDTSLGTLNSITVDVSGTANEVMVLNSFEFHGVVPGDDPNAVVGIIPGTGQIGDVGSSFSFSANGTFSSDLAYFEGTGTSTVVLVFGGTTLGNSTTNTSGTVTYNFTPVDVTPPAAAAPEPSSLALLGSGVLGLAGVLRRRMR
jgi:hypothetical protein